MEEHKAFTLPKGTLILGKCRIEELIGEGAFGYVYRAFDTRLHRTVAVKELSPNNPKLSTTLFDDFRRRFEREARVQAQFTHPHVVQVHELGQEGDAYYLVMEYVDGPNLRDYLAEKGPLSIKEALRITLEALEALQVVHEHAWDIVHRDVKPSNILLAGKGETKLADFGVAQVGEESLRTLTERLQMGTPLYMAPEAARGETYLWPQADLFGVGCVLFEMVAGTPYKKALRRRKGLPDLRPDAPAWLEGVLAQALAKEPEERYESAEEFAEALAQAEEEARREAAARERQQREARERKERERQAREAREQAERARRAREAAAARAAKLADLRKRAEEALAQERWPEAFEAADEWLQLEQKSERAAEILAQARLMLEGPPLRRTPSGLVIATPENLGWLLSWPEPPERVWWEKAEMEFCLVPAGEFLMGISEGEARQWHKQFGGEMEWQMAATPQHTVTLSAYYIGRYLVTQAQYARFVKATGHRVPYLDPKESAWAKPYNWNKRRKTPPKGKEDHPVVLVSWKDAVAYCEWAGLRLPEEAEWERAASWDPPASPLVEGIERGRKRTYPWGDEWDSQKCNNAEKWAGRELRTDDEWKKWWDKLDQRRQARTTSVGAYSPRGDSPCGCADMAGNVWEWCADWYKGYPGTTCQLSEFGETYRVLRGGPWSGDRSEVRSARRFKSYPGSRGHGLGFRCCVSPTSSL